MIAAEAAEAMARNSLLDMTQLRQFRPIITSQVAQVHALPVRRWLQRSPQSAVTEGPKRQA
jgi:hypothetical protein